MLVTIGITLLIRGKYTSTTQLMPPDQQAISSASVLNALAAPGPAMPNVAEGLINGKTPGGICIGILRSHTVQNDIINRFDLRSVYHHKLYAETRHVLSERSVIDEDKKSGIISLSVTDRDPNRARDIAKAYIEELDKLFNALNTSSARRERVFLEGRLTSIKRELDASSARLSQFSSRNATLDYQKQSEATVGAVANLQGELIAAQGSLSELKASYTEDNMRVRRARAKVRELYSQLQKMDGVSESPDDAGPAADTFMPSVRRLPLLGATYADLYRRVAMEEAIYETLNKQYELSKVQEAKELPSIKVLDEPDKPEERSSPNRLLIIISGTLLSAIGGFIWLIICEFWDLRTDSLSTDVHDVPSLS